MKTQSRLTGEMTMATCTWQAGQLPLPFTILTHGAEWSKNGGVYVFAYQDETGVWRALYVGMTDDFSSRIQNHDRWDEAVRLGATHVHAHTENDEALRGLIEKQMVSQLQPCLNDSLKQGTLSPSLPAWLQNGLKNW